MAASVKSCLAAGHVMCEADPPGRTASERVAAEESVRKETDKAPPKVRRTGGGGWGVGVARSLI